MGFKKTTQDMVKAVAYARDSDAKEILTTLNYLTSDYFADDEPFSYSGDIYQVYKITITIEPA